MNDLDVLTDRLRDLGQRAPVPVADPLLDIRRGRLALRRRRARSVAGLTTAVVAVGSVAVTVPLLAPRGSGDPALQPAASPSGAVTPDTTPTTDPCVITVRRGQGVTPLSGSREYAETPEVVAALASYRAAAAAVLDPAGRHLEPVGSERNDNVQAGYDCRAKELTSLGTKLGWTTGDALGVVQLEVVAPEHDEKPQIVLAHDGWRPYDGALPAGVRKARVVVYYEDGGGRAVVAERADGLAVAVDAAGVWGNNVVSGTASARTPSVAELLALAASPRLTLPED
ncbi:hypothetical protein EFK50_15445 [Nocardioides marmoriginsengisoli]|uniref:Uncharacterized protein n=1 Tax=Nocardioides marmoriginsengisoli TaxID=661483 RepID=A0A3N0CI44_9ACTN|nr:hypothetical protein [Nocardioides marmoriginsengisoli]RNL63104.1 hypothetical protein EFK50_15445 [Nocardioides marmoriginsengisoli]